MERVVREAERTGRAAVEQAYVQRLPKNLTAGPAATALRHLKLWYCMLPDGALPPLGDTGTRCDDAQAAGEREGLATGEGHSTPQVEGFGARLRSLHLGSNLLTRVPEGLERLGHLRELILDGNYLTAIPPSLLQLRRLTLLVLSYNSLTALPDGFWGAFPELTYLSLHHNGLTSLGTDFYELGPRVEVLYLHYNKIAHIEPPPASVPSSSLASLRSLSLSHNELSSVPAGLMSRLTGLSLLFLENNRLEELPDAVCGLTRLELLRVDCNRLQRLPNGMSGMMQLIALDCDHNQIQALPRDVLQLKESANLRVLRAVDNPFQLEATDELLLSTRHSLFCDVYDLSALVVTVDNVKAADDGEADVAVRRGRGSCGGGLSVPLLLGALAGEEQLRQMPGPGCYDLRSSYSHLSSVSQLQVYRQWDSASCGYHALKNAIIGALAVINRNENEEISESVLRLMRSAPHFWALFFHWQALLLHKAEEVREKARAQGRKWDVVWEDVNIKHGIMERNYIDHFQKRDNIIQEIGAEHFVVISDLGYITSDPYDVPAIVALDDSLTMRSGPIAAGRHPVKAFVIGVSKSHFVTVIAYLDRSNRPKYIICDSSDYEDQATAPSSTATEDGDEEEVEMDIDEQLGTQRKVRGIEPNVRMVIECLMGQDSFRSFYLRQIVEGFIHQSLMLLLDWDTNQVDPAKVEDWQLSASTFFASFWAKAIALGVQHVPSSTKDEIRAYCRQLCVNEQVRQLLHWMLSENREGVAAVFGLSEGEDPLSSLLAASAHPARM